MLVSLLLCLCAVASVAVCDGHTALEEKYSYSLVLSSGNYELYWSFDACNENVSIAVRVKTLGWVGLGVSERGGMENADIVTGQVVNGNAELTDRFATTQDTPSQDTSQNWFLIGGSENDGWTTLEFWRYLDTGDADEDRVITETSNPVIFAWGTTDTLEYHSTRRGSQAVNFVQGDMGPSVPSGAKTFQLLVNNVTIPDTDTTYWCEGFILPEEIRSETRHIIKYSPVIHELASAHVHHMLLYTCDGSGIDSFTDEQLSGAECITGGSGADPKLLCLQGNLVAAWAVGASDFYFPEDVSFSIGGPDASRYLVVEMHYDNPTGVSGVIDNSGFEFTYLEDARCFDAGILNLGNEVSPTMVIPPGQDSFDVFGVCDTSCTQNFPAEGITVFANVLHTHLAGHGLSLRHYRNGVEVTPSLDEDLNYDFNFQQHRSVTPRKIMPGDVLELECNYRTTDRNITTFGGVSTLEEMCLSFLSYYPRSVVTECQSSLDFRTLVTDLRLDEVGVNLNQSDDFAVYLESEMALSSPDFPWDGSRVEALSNRYMSARINDGFHYQCDINQAVLAANFTGACHNKTEAVTVTNTVCTTETPTETGPTDATTEFELPSESENSGTVAAVMKLSSAITLVMTAIAAFLQVA